MNASVLRMEQMLPTWTCRMALPNSFLLGERLRSLIPTKGFVSFVKFVVDTKKHDCFWRQITFANERGMDVDEMRCMRNISWEFSWQHSASYLAYSPTKRPIVANSPKIRQFLYNTENQYITSKHLHQEPAFRAFVSQKHCYKGDICMLLHA